MIRDWILTSIISMGVGLHASYNDRVVYIKVDQVKVSHIKTISPDKFKKLTGGPK